VSVEVDRVRDGREFDLAREGQLQWINLLFHTTTVPAKTGRLLGPRSGACGVVE